MHFDFIAPYYDRISRLVFGSTLETSRVSQFHKVCEGSKILFIGGGTGASLKTLLSLKKNLTIDYVEPSSKMISLAKKRMEEYSPVNFHEIRIEEFDGSGYDIIITEFFFDLFEESKIQELIELIKSKLAKNGKWIETDFRETEGLKNKLILKLMYWFFDITTNLRTTSLVNTKPLFKDKELEIGSEKFFHSGFISSQIITQL